MAFRISAVLLAAALVQPQSATAALEPRTVFTADYTVSFFGFTVARSTVVSHFGATSYTIDGSIRSAGLAAFFDSTTARTSVSGKIGRQASAPTAIRSTTSMGKRPRRPCCSLPKAMS